MSYKLIDAEIHVEGMSDLKNMLRNIAPRAAQNIGRSAVQSIASAIAKDVKANIPKSVTGALRRSVQAVRKKSYPNRPKSMVRFNAKAKDVNEDAYYWKFVEYGKRAGKKGEQKPTHFVAKIKEKYRAQMPTLMREAYGKKLEAYLVRQAKKPKSLR
jgi:HK97 gp10 family phage protein